MFDFTQYRLKFDAWGLVLFIIIMIPNFIWFAVPAGNDILRGESLTPNIDFIASIFQVIMVAALCLIVNNTYQKLGNQRWIIAIVAMVALYYLSWCMYYAQIVNLVVILILCVAPCVAFLIFSFVKNNGVGFVSASIFMICHVIYGCVNFIAKM